jgi:type IV fimbrial biogenesis protein FimT
MNKQHQPHSHFRGMALIELVAVLVILAILLASALPSLQSLTARAQLTTAKNSLILGLQRARAEAASRGRDSVLCPSEDGLRCLDGSDWSNGWVLFVDFNRNGRFDPVEPLLLSQSLDADRVSVRSTSGRRRITYRSLGESAGSNVTFVICSRRRPEHAGQVIVANSGRVRSLDFAPAQACSA